ncbi:MAG: hypothetical protein WCF44_15035 [Candidatus Methylophosphatis roskildensis]
MQNQRPPDEGPAFRLGQGEVRFGASRPGPLGRLLGAIIWAGLLVVAFMFSLVFFAIVVAVGLLVWAYLWWNTRELRKQMRDRPPGGSAQPPGGQVIEGEVIRDQQDGPPP